MREQLIKAMEYHQVVELMYMSKSGKITKRKVRVIKITGYTLQAYCFTRQAKRTFIIDNVLAVLPVTKKEKEVI